MLCCTLCKQNSARRPVLIVPYAFVVFPLGEDAAGLCLEAGSWRRLSSPHLHDAALGRDRQRGAALLRDFHHTG